MRILLAHNQYSITGGAEVFFHEIARLLRANGHEVALFSCAEDGIDAPYSAHFPRVARYNEGGLLAKIGRVPAVIYNHDARRRMRHLLADFKPDVLHAFAIYGRLTPSILDAARLAGVPVVLSCNDYKHLCPNYKLFHHGSLCMDCKGGAFHHALRNRCCHDSTAISAVSMLEAYVHDRLDVWRKNVSLFLFASQFMARKTVEFWGEDAIKLDMLPNPFNAEQHRLPESVGNHILYFGRLIDEKGVDILIRAARLAPEIPVVVVGDGPDRQRLEALGADLPQVRFVGPAWGDQLAPHLMGARAVVVPSLWHENFPYVIFQAFAASKPVIGSNRGGIPELVHAGPHGWTYEATDPAALAQAMRLAFALPDAELLDMGRAAYAYVAREFNDEAIYARLMRIYSEVIQ